MKYNKTKKCPACSHGVELSRKTKVVRQEKHYINIVCDFCSHIFPIERNEKENEKTTN